MFMILKDLTEPLRGENDGFKRLTHKNSDKILGAII